MDDTVPRQVVIAGAGIGGLTAALAFAQRGYRVRLFEQAASIEAVGAGIQLSPNATHILDRLGVLEGLLDLAVEPRAVVLKDARSLCTLAEVPLGESGKRRWGAPYLVAHRGDLQGALLAAVQDMAEIELFSGARVSGVSADLHGITASILINGQLREAGGSLLVGSDGVWSTIRSLCGVAVSRFTDELAWRATASVDSPAGSALSRIADPACVTAFLHSGSHLVAYPMRGGAAFNLVAFTRGDKISANWSGEADVAVLHRAMRNTAPALARLAVDVGPWTAWPVHTVEQQSPWTSSNGVALIGDAAHAMTPFAAQGAAMAIEDAATLAAEVATAPSNFSQALVSWETVRKTRVVKVARRGALNHLAWHAAGPVALARNLVLKTRPGDRLAADLDWLYGWRAPD
jgi:salicylate hydroxylase